MSADQVNHMLVTGDTTVATDIVPQAVNACTCQWPMGRAPQTGHCVCPAFTGLLTDAHAACTMPQAQCMPAALGVPGISLQGTGNAPD